MTKQEAIAGCMKQWEYYAKTGTGNKGDYKPAKYLRSECFFCEYKKSNDCNKTCPGWGYWADNTKNPTIQGHCVDDSGIYRDKQTALFRHWENSGTKKERKLWASRIVWMVWLIEKECK